MRESQLGIASEPFVAMPHGCSELRQQCIALEVDSELIHRTAAGITPPGISPKTCDVRELRQHGLYSKRLFEPRAFGYLCRTVSGPMETASICSPHRQQPDLWNSLMPINDLSHETTEKLRTLSQRNARESGSRPGRARNCDFASAPSDIAGRSISQLTVGEVLALYFDGNEGADSGAVLAAHNKNLRVLANVTGPDWKEEFDRRPLLLSAAYLSSLWIPATCRFGREGAVRLATRFLFTIRAAAFYDVVGAGRKELKEGFFPKSLRLLLVGPVFNSLAMSIQGADRALKLGVWYLLDSFYSEPDPSPCAAIWAPSLGFLAGIRVPEQWFASELSNHSELLQTYRLALLEQRTAVNETVGQDPAEASPEPHSSVVAFTG
ncbi:MAG: hypothetical protein U0892_16765 [Pirellulales bacterium]